MRLVALGLLIAPSGIIREGFCFVPQRINVLLDFAPVDLKIDLRFVPLVSIGTRNGKPTEIKTDSHNDNHENKQEF